MEQTDTTKFKTQQPHQRNSSEQSEGYHSGKESLEDDLFLTCNENISQISPPNPATKDDHHHQEYHHHQNNHQPVEDNEVKEPVKAVRDSRLLGDPRVLKNLLKLEEACVPKTPDYIRQCQPELNPSMRKIVTEWMLQVCQECYCNTDVFLLAVNFMDRFLARVGAKIPKTRLQLVGTVCLLISSKFKETVPVSGERLIFYTDNSISPEEVREMELLVLQTLQWEVSTVTSMDFLDHILTRLSESSNNQHQGIINIDKVNFTKQIEELKIKMEQVLVLAVTDYFFSYLNPSLLAASAAHLVLSRLTNETKITEDLCQYIGAITSDVQDYVSQLEKIVPNYLLRFSQMNLTEEEKAIALDKKSNSLPTSDYGSSISSSTETNALTNAPPQHNDSFIMVN